MREMGSELAVLLLFLLQVILMRISGLERMIQIKETQEFMHRKTLYCVN